MAEWEKKVKDAFASIAWYNGYMEWALKLAEDLDRFVSDYTFFSCPLPCEEWHTDKHALWMMLVEFFGDWGTSIRSGWIEETAAAAEFIRDALKDLMEEVNDEP